MAILSLFACCWHCNKRGVVNTVAGGTRLSSHKLWHLYRWSSGRTLCVFDQHDKVTVSVVLQCKSDQARCRTIHNHDRSCLTARLDVTPKTTEQNWILRTSKSEAEVTNNKKKLCSRYCTTDATKLTTDRHEASCCLFATVELLVTTVLSPKHTFVKYIFHLLI